MSKAIYTKTCEKAWDGDAYGASELTAPSCKRCASLAK